MIATACTYTEAAKHFGIKPDSIKARSMREEWPLPIKVLRKAQEIVAQQSKPGAVTGATAIAEQAQNWVEKGEISRALAYRIAIKGLQKAESKELPVDSWQDVERIDKMARRAAGLEDGDASKVQVGVQVNMLDARNIPESIRGQYVLPEVAAPRIME